MVCNHTGLHRAQQAYTDPVQSSLVSGRQPTTTSSMAPATYYATANAAIDGLATTYPDMTATVVKPAHTDFRRFDNNVNSLVAADKQDPLRVCPSSCLSIGNLASEYGWVQIHLRQLQQQQLAMTHSLEKSKDEQLRRRCVQHGSGE